jgi:hypothetical protein
MVSEIAPTCVQGVGNIPRVSFRAYTAMNSAAISLPIKSYSSQSKMISCNTSIKST